MSPRVLLVFALIGSAGATNAQSTPVRRGLEFSIGLGGGDARIECASCASTGRAGSAALLQAGLFVRPTLLIAAEVAALAGPYALGGTSESITFVTPIVQWYPLARSGFHVKGGIGFATGHFYPGTERVTSDGVGLSVGAGFEAAVSRRISLAPYAVYHRTVGARVGRPSAMRGNTFAASALQFGVMIGLHRARSVRPATS